MKKGNKVAITLKDYKGEDKQLTYDPFLFGVVKGLHSRRLRNWHGLILITGDVGDGKSTLADGICGLDSYFTKKKYDLDNVVFSTKDFEELTDKDDNYLQAIKYDEAIEGATNQDMARSKKGLSFKKKIIQKRKKKHLYVMCIDELEEYSWKLIKKANLWIHVKAHGVKRGYFDMTWDKNKIKNKYLALKNKQYHLVKKIYPDKANSTFMNYENIFFNDDEYQFKKDEMTKSEETIAKEKKNEERNKYIINMLNKGLTQQEVANITGLARSTVRDIKAKMVAS